MRKSIFTICNFLVLASAMSIAHATSDPTSEIKKDLEKQIIKKANSKGNGAAAKQQIQNLNSVVKTVNKSKKSRRDRLISLEKAKKLNQSKESNSKNETTSSSKKPNTNSADAKAVALNTQIVDSEDLKKRQKEAAFNTLVSDSFPMSPDQIIKYRKIYDESKKAASTTPNSPPTPVTSSIKVDLSPGAIHPVIRLSKGFVSSLVFVDSTGAPWPIVAYSIGDPDAFDIQWDEVSNSLFVQSNLDYTHGNMAVRLKDLNTPVMLSFVTGQRVIDYRADLRVSARGPFAKAAIIAQNDSSSKNNSLMMNLLDGLPPKGSKKLTIDKEFGQAWLHNGSMYLRSELTLLSPAWVSTLSSADGTKVYELKPTPSLLASKDGNTFNVTVRGL